ncbi:MAG: DoxX family protein [Geminocystis sp. GBBB08]|nr:DoxX family protein [Geminocystis sp. GBBB08]
MLDLNTIISFLPEFHTGAEAIGIAILRIIWGTTLIFYGLPMLKRPFTWMDMPKPSGIPGFLQLIGALTIFGGGITIALGFLTFLASLALTGAMGLALILNLLKGVPFMKERPDAPGTSYEASLVYLAIALMFVFVGPGVFSLDYLLFGH